jgi:peptidoglycan/LPS O-acetylase OafA/YrhL
VFSYMSPGVHVLHKLAGLSPSLYALFVLGVAGARFAVPGCRPDRRRWELFLVALLVAAVAIEIACRSRFDPLGPLNDLWLGPLAALVVCRIADGDLRRLGRFLASRPMVWLGSSSYSLYLIHPFLLEMVWRWAVRPLGLPQLQALAVELVVGVSVSIAASRAFYRFIEQPFLGTSAPTVETPVASAHEARGRFLRRPAPEPVKTS